MPTVYCTCTSVVSCVFGQVEVVDDEVDVRGELGRVGGHGVEALEVKDEDARELPD